MSTFMLTCVTCTCYVTSRVLGWVGVGCVNVRYIHMLRHVLGSGEWGVCVCVNVHVNLRHTHLLASEL